MADEIDNTEDESTDEVETDEVETESSDSDNETTSDEVEVDERDNQIVALRSQLVQMESDHSTAIANLTAAKDAVIAELRAELSQALRTLPGNTEESESDDDYDSDTIPTFDDLVAKATGQKVD